MNKVTIDSFWGEYRFLSNFYPSEISIEVKGENFTFLEIKFHPHIHPELHNKLLQTHPHELIEGNTWGDKYWGVCDGVGKNKLGTALMDIRDNYVFANKFIEES